MSSAASTNSPEATSFLDHFKLMAELCTSAQHAVHVVKRKKDGGLFILKAVCLLGRDSEEREAVVFEAVRWRHTSHPRLLQVLSVVEESGFVYTLYEHADGRDLFSTMWSQNNMAEHSVKAILSAVLSAVGYCHKKGIVHGNIDPRNIIFTESAKRAGWMHSAKLTSFVEYDKAPGSTPSRATDFKDVAYLAAWLLMNPDDVIRDLNRSSFRPGILHAQEWAHVSPEAFDLIDRLWADGATMTAAEFLEHPWFRTISATGETDDPDAIPWSPAKLSSPRVAMEGWIWKKDVNKDVFGRRQWHRKFAQLQGTSLLFYNAEPPSVRIAAAARAAAEKEEAHTDANRVVYKGGGTEADEERQRQMAAGAPELPVAVPVAECSVIDFPSLKYKHVFAIRHVETQQNLVYLRCDSPEEERKWRRAIANQIAADHTAAQKLALSTALNFLTPAFAASSEHAGEVTLDIGKGGVVMRLSESEQGAAGMGSRRGSGASIDSSVMSGTTHETHYPEGSWKHPAEHWNHRAEELDRVLRTGKPPSAPVQPGEVWYIVDATWFKHWFAFVTSTRRMSPPGPVDNNWMINPRKGAPFRDLMEDTDSRPGDFRRVTPEIWAIFMEIYGGGPAIWVTGPPLEHTKRWQVEGLDTQTPAQAPSILSKLFNSGSAAESKADIHSPNTLPTHRRTRTSGVSFAAEPIRRRSTNDLYGRRKMVEVKPSTPPAAAAAEAKRSPEPRSPNRPRDTKEHKSSQPPKESREGQMFSKLGSVYQQARSALVGAK